MKTLTWMLLLGALFSCTKDKPAPRGEKLSLDPKLEKGSGEIIVSRDYHPSGEYQDFDGLFLRYNKKGHLVTKNEGRSGGVFREPRAVEKRVTSVIGTFVTERIESHTLRNSALFPEFEVSYRTVDKNAKDRKKFRAGITDLFKEKSLIEASAASKRLQTLSLKTGVKIKEPSDLVRIFGVAGEKRLEDSKTRFDYTCYVYWSWPKDGDMKMETLGFSIDSVEKSGEFALVRIFANRFHVKECLNKNAYRLKLEFKDALKAAAKKSAANSWIGGGSLPRLVVTSRFGKTLSTNAKRKLKSDQGKAKKFPSIKSEDPKTLLAEMNADAPADHGRCLEKMKGEIIVCKETRGIKKKEMRQRSCEGTNNSEHSLATNIVAKWSYGSRCPRKNMVGACLRERFGEEFVEVFYTAGKEGGWTRETLQRQCKNISPGKFYKNKIPSDK